MQKRRINLAVLAALAALVPALLLANGPVQASEVVKLARLVITGKRLSAERLEPVALQKTGAPAAAPLARTSPVQPQHSLVAAEQAPVGSGQDVLSRSAAAPSRGVLSFF